MKWLLSLTIILLTAAMLTSEALSDDPPLAVSDVVLGIHGGIGTPRNELAAGEEEQLREVMEQALLAGRKVLQNESATGLDAVEAAIRIMEDSPLFNAGKGAVFTDEGRNELDASIMEGRDKRAGAVAGVTNNKNPNSAARAVMEKSPHVLLIGRGAEVFATQAGIETVDPSYFWTLPRWQQIEEHWRKDKRPAIERQSSLPDAGHPWGTVGAVAVDRHGNLAAGTSTGGMSGKRFGRVGDSPILGAGTYADNAGCAVSCTGHGEYFIRIGVAHEINALMKYKDLSVETAAQRVIDTTLTEAGGEGAAIALDSRGRFTAAFNTECLYRGWIGSEGKPQVRLFGK